MGVTRIPRNVNPPAAASAIPAVKKPQMSLKVGRSDSGSLPAKSAPKKSVVSFVVPVPSKQEPLEKEESEEKGSGSASSSRSSSSGSSSPSSSSASDSDSPARPPMGVVRIPRVVKAPTKSVAAPVIAPKLKPPPSSGFTLRFAEGKVQDLGEVRRNLKSKQNKLISSPRMTLVQSPSRTLLEK